jgi:hypothetical protein
LWREGGLGIPVTEASRVKAQEGAGNAPRDVESCLEDLLRATVCVGVVLRPGITKIIFMGNKNHFGIRQDYLEYGQISEPEEPLVLFRRVLQSQN